MNEVEYGRIVVVKKDGTEGDFFSISTDLTIGRDKDSDIRVKLTSVSRLHCRIKIDNGNCIIINESKTNPTIINSIKITGQQLLQNGDTFTVGDRQFIFKCAELKDNILLKTRHIPVLETINESISEIDNSLIEDIVLKSTENTPKSPLKVKTPIKSKTPIKIIEDDKSEVKKISTPLRNAINSRRKSGGSELIEKKSKNTQEEVEELNTKDAKKRMLTPLKDAINKRRKSGGSSLLQNDTNEPNVEQIIVKSTKKVMPDYLKTAINARRKSGGSALKIIHNTDENNTLKDEKIVLVKKISTPLRSAINARRKSGRVVVDDVENISKSVEEKEKQIENVEVEEKEKQIESVEDVVKSSKKIMSNLLKDAIHARRKSIKLISDEVIVVNEMQVEENIISSKMKLMSTPLRLAINSRRKSGGSALTQAQVESILELEPVKPIITSAKKMSTPIRLAINSRRKSSKMEANEMIEEQQAENVEDVVKSSKKIMSNLLKDAIHARRKSGASSISKLESVLQMIETKEDTKVIKLSPKASPKSLKKSLRTPLRAAINARRKSFENDNNNEIVEENYEKLPTSTKKTIRTPLREEINSRRKSYSIKNVPTTPVEETNLNMDNISLDQYVANIEMAITVRRESLEIQKVEEEVKIAVMTSNSPIRSPIKSPIKSPIRTNLLCDEISQKINENLRILPTPIRIALNKRRQSYSKIENNNSPKKEVVINSPVGDDHNGKMADENDQINDSLNESLSSPSKLFEDDDEQDNSKNNLIEATCVQISVDSFANELEIQGYQPDFAYQQATEHYLENPQEFEYGCSYTLEDFISPFSPVQVRALKRESIKRDKRNRNSILDSIEKKGKKAHDEWDEAIKLSVDLISALSDSEMNLINSYASQLELQCDMDSNDAFGMALDSFIRGIERCHSMIATQIVTEEKNAAIEQIDDVDTDDEGEVVKLNVIQTKISNMEVNSSLVKKSIPESMNLASLLQIPRVHTEEEDRDIELVEQYAEELQEAANLDAAIAYGIALDSFIADPIEFRKHIGKKVVEIGSKIKSSASEIMNYGSSLRLLFQLPGDYADQEDKDIELVEQYAKELMHSSNLDDAIAYGIALDSFIADPIEFRKHIGKKIKSIPEIMNYGSSLRLLFQLPGDYADQEDRDIELVEQYAEELQEAANLDAAIAYGIALDSFIADPIEFRKHLGGFVEPIQLNVKTPMSSKKVASKSAVKSAVKIVEQEIEEIQEEVKTLKTPASNKKSDAKTPLIKTPVLIKKATPKSAVKSAVKIIEQEIEEIQEEVKTLKTPASNKKSVAKTPVIKTPVLIKKATPNSAVKTPVSIKKSTPAKTPVSIKKSTPNSSKSSSKSVVVEDDDEEEEDEDEEKEDIVDVILCDGCDGEFILEELNLKLEEVPDGDWFCPACEKKRLKGKKRKNIVENVVDKKNTRHSSRRM